MKIIHLKANGTLSKKQEARFGGAYSTLQQIALGGTGSPRLVYEAGIPAFDELTRDTASEIGFVNFELLKDGLMLRLNINQRRACVGSRLSEIKAIDLVAFEIKIRKKVFYYLYRYKTVHCGELTINYGSSTVTFRVVTREFKSILQYFSKPPFRGKFNYSVSTKPPEKDYSHLIQLLDGFV